MKRKRPTSAKLPRATQALPGATLRALDEALGRHRAGDLEAAVRGYREVLATHPTQADALTNLGVALTKLGQPSEAVAVFERACAAAPGSAVVHRIAGACLTELGRWEASLAALQRAIAIDPGDVEAFCQLGQALVETGHEEAARPVLERAVLLAPLHARAWFEMHRAVFDAERPAAAIDALTRAVASDPGLVWARFLLGVALDLAGDPRAAARQMEGLHPDPKVFAGAVDSWRYVREKKTERTRFFATTYRTLRFAVEEAKLEGPSLELGVRYGTSTRWIAAAEAPRTLHGFDSFQGLPEAWHVQPMGAYTTHGDLPPLPGNVELHVGLFEDTIPRFVASHPGPLRLVHVDCDLYSSTRTGLGALAGGIVPGTILVFDDYLVNDRWRLDEFKAFQEVALERTWRYEYLAVSLATGQAVVRILA